MHNYVQAPPPPPMHLISFLLGYWKLVTEVELPIHTRINRVGGKLDGGTTAALAAALLFLWEITVWVHL